MPGQDFPLNTATLSGHGGRREGSGQKPGGYVRPPEAVDFDKAKVRTEVGKAEKIERENKVALGLLVSRAAVQQASAVAYAGLAQTMRSISDNLEREGVPLDICAKVEAVIEAAMADHSAQMELMAGSVEEEAQ